MDMPVPETLNNSQNSQNSQSSEKALCDDTKKMARISISGFLEKDTINKTASPPPAITENSSSLDPKPPQDRFENGAPKTRDYPKGSHRFGTLRFLDSSIRAHRPHEIVQKPDMVSQGEWWAVHATLFYNHAAMLFGQVEQECKRSPHCRRMMGGREAEYLGATGREEMPKSTPAHQYILNLLQWMSAHLEQYPTKDFAEYPSDFAKTYKTFTKRVFRIFAHLNYCHRRHLPNPKALDDIMMHFLFFTKHFKLMEKREFDVLRKRYDEYARELGLVKEKPSRARSSKREEKE